MEHMYDVLNLLVDACVQAGTFPIAGGDFNPCIGLIDGDDLTLLQHVGPIGMGQGKCKRHNVDTLDFTKQIVHVQPGWIVTAR